MAWKEGPLPPNTYGWGGVVPADMGGQDAFYLADFKGDSVECIPTGRVLRADEVAKYDNSLTLPSGLGFGFADPKTGRLEG